MDDDDDFEPQARPSRRTPVSTKAAGGGRSLASSGSSSASAATTAASDGRSSSSRSSGRSGGVKRERSSGVGGGLIDLTEETDEDEDEDEDDDEDGMEVEAGQAIAQAQGPDLGGLGGVRLMAIPGGPADEEEALYLAALEERDELSDRTKKLQLPPNPLDEIMDRLGGPDKVAGNTLSHIHTPVLYTSPSHNFQTIFLTPLINAPLMSRSFSFLFFLLIFLRAELTGRKDRLVRQKNGTFRLVSRSANGVSLDKQNMLEKKLFMKDKKQVAIISDAASTGISLQADRRVKNQRQRVHITFELAWSADKAIQQMGRTHRANQSSAPEYHLLISPQGGEKRFAAAVARRLESLGALTQGDRSAIGARTMSVSAFNLESVYGTKALKNNYDSYFALVGRQAFQQVSLCILDCQCCTLFPLT